MMVFILMVMVWSLVKKLSQKQNGEPIILCIAMAISEAARSQCAGMIVLGATGHGPVRHALLGSVADALR